jgi:phosphohistidine swiveling domain-containing protein
MTTARTAEAFNSSDSNAGMAIDRPPYVIDLAQVSAGDLAAGGGKAANLGELLRWGFPVPPGFVVTTAAYDRVVESNGLQDEIANVSQPDRAATTRTGFESASIPPQVEREILDAYRRLGGGAVAVRSSATAEDLPEAAFAGQQETFFGIIDEDVLLQAVRRCWASLWSDRAIEYRRRHELADTPVKLAVIVQRLVPAEAAGVLFTANPVTGARDETIVEASTGLGEAVVSGQVTPDHIILRHARHRWRIVERRLGRREVEVRPTAGGVELVKGVPSDEPALPDAVLLQLARMGDSIARRFGRPQDIEWAWADGKIFILQSRPITALPEPPARRGRFELPNFAADYLQVRPYPLDMTTWTAAFGEALPRMFPVNGLVPPLRELWAENDGVVERVADLPRPRPNRDLLRAPARIVSLARRYDPAHWRDDPLLVATLSRIRELESRDLRALTWDELLAVAREAMAMPLAIIEIRRRYFPRGVLALGALWLLIKGLGLSDRFGILLSGVDNRTLAANRTLETLAAEVRSDRDLAEAFERHDAAKLLEALRGSAAGRAFLERFEAFLDEFGHRETGSPLLVSQPTWKDAPETVLGILKGLARAKPAERPGNNAWEEARDEVLDHPVLGFAPMRTLFLNLLTEARRLSALREDTHFAATAPMPILRRSLLELGRRLADAGIIVSAEDVFHLRFDELERVGGAWPPATGLASELRQSSRQRAERRAALAETPLMDLQSMSRLAPGGEIFVTGTPGSPGIAEGPVRIVREPAAFGTLQPGDVLVAPYTNPSWTPIFGRAAAVVVDTGAAMSHAAIVAREYGLPAVMGTGDGTRRLSDGQWVRVDGTQGVVLAASAPGEDAPPRIAVDADGEDQNGSGGDRLPERGDAVEVERVRHETEQEDAENRAGHPSPAATE